jgi:monoterpene epsilon-lactone hydrolase
MHAENVSRVANGKLPLWLLLLTAIAPGMLSDVSVAGEESGARPQVDTDGVAHLPAMRVPASRFMSPEARRRFIALFSKPQPGPPPGADIRAVREDDERKNAPYVARAETLYPVNIEQKMIGGVRTEVITPRSGIAPRNHDRVLINLHGGGFLWGEGNGAKAESIPIAGLGRITVITVAYRMAPEFKFPAASEDVASVYRELLKTHSATDIGIYGCSAGGVLTAEAIAWFQQQKLPMPGAIGTFCGSASGPGGDSSHLASPLVGEVSLAGADAGSLSFMPYFDGASSSDPLVLPINSQRVLSGFPPTLLIAGSRDFTVSSLFHTQAALSRAGVEAELHVWDGMWHAFFFDPDLPESQEVYHVVVNFFDRHLGRTSAATPSAPPHR